MKRLLFLIMISRKTGTGISKLGDPFFDYTCRMTKTRDEDGYSGSMNVWDIQIL